MKERPILFSAPMVRAILAGTKTVTRRIVKGAPHAWDPAVIEVVPSLLANRGDLFDFRRRLDTPVAMRCPYGAPGDRLWVKEAIRKMEPPDLQHEDGSPVVYSQYIADDAWTVASAWPWKRDVLPGMFMPRGLRRITLEVVSVRVERLHDISEEDARAEGVESCDGLLDAAELCRAAKIAGNSHEDARGWFAALWFEINGEESWLANPWVWRVEFKRVEPTC